MKHQEEVQMTLKCCCCFKCSRHCAPQELRYHPVLLRNYVSILAIHTAKLPNHSVTNQVLPTEPPGEPRIMLTMSVANTWEGTLPASSELKSLFVNITTRKGGHWLVNIENSFILSHLKTLCGQAQNTVMWFTKEAGWVFRYWFN